MNLKKKAQVIMLPKKHSNLSLYENKLSLAKANHNGIPDKMIPQHLFIVDDSEIKEGDWFINILINKPFQCVEILDNLIHYRTELGSTVIHINDCKKVIATTDKNLKFEINNSGWKSSQENGWNEYKPEYKQLPSPSEQFIQKYVESYNKGCEISEINIDYQEYFMSNVGDKFTVNKDLYGLSKGTSLTIKSFNFKNDPDLIEYEEDNIHNQGIHISHTNIKTEFVLKVDSKNLVTITRCKDSWDREELLDNMFKVWKHLRLHYRSADEQTMKTEFDKWIEENL